MTGIPRTALAPGYTISRVLKGGWQLAGGHGPVDEAAALDDMDAFVAAGVTTFDCADIYTGVEALIGRYRQRLCDRDGAEAAARIQVHTKCVPDREQLTHLTRAQIAHTIDRSCQRLGVESLDLVQLHWWDYEIDGVLDAARWIDEQRRDGRVRHIGLTNFDAGHVQRFVDAGIPVVSNQVQYSVLDLRPAAAMTGTCARCSVGLLAYGALAGGFLSERWLGQPAPPEPLENRSLVKYRLIIDECGGWDYFQGLLATLRAVAGRHGVGIGAVAVRWTLDQPGVTGVIVGARHRRHLEETLAAFSFALDADDRARIARAQASATGPRGEVYGLERIRGGRHAVIMRENLQRL
jgi:aryl-alcohol dehydrogenase-like predicted oxidoreductase